MKPAQIGFAFCLTVITVTLVGCKSFKSYETVYQDQQSFFNTNRTTFEAAAGILKSSMLRDTTLFVNDSHLGLPDSVARKLRGIGIAEISVFKGDCPTKEIRFTPDSLWDAELFSVMEIIYDNCDERNQNGYHWVLEGSQHKHSFGQGGGWFIYSDTDRDPF